ncbi:hypothetical protein PS15m_009510 [Mucor circinelloides]
MDSPSNINTEKVPFTSKDFLSLQSRLQDYIQEVLQQATISSAEERVLIQSELDQWTTNVFIGLRENSAFTDTDSIDNRVKANLVDPTDEKLKDAVRSKELDFANNLSKVVKYRAQVPSVVAKFSKEVCESESLEAEELQIELPTVDLHHDQFDVASLEPIKEEYTDAMQILSHLEKSTPKEINQVAKVQKISAIVMERGQA